MTYTNDDLLKMTPDQLSALFRDSPPGPIPNGAAKGTALIDTGTPISPVLAEIIRVQVCLTQTIASFWTTPQTRGSSVKSGMRFV